MSTAEQYYSLRTTWRKSVIHGLYVVAMVFLLIEVVAFFAFLLKGHSFSVNNIFGHLFKLNDNSSKAELYKGYLVGYLGLPSGLNFVFIILADLANRNPNRTERLRNGLVICSILWECMVASTWHSFFPITTAMYIAPVLLSCMMDDARLFKITVAMSALLMTVSIFLASLFDDTWTIHERGLNLVICLIFFGLTCVICMEIERFSRRKNDIVSRGAQLEREMMIEAKCDSMTGLFNHSEFENYLSEHIKEDMVLAIIDVDHFKNVNDTYGHKSGDEVLVRISAILSQFVGNKGIVYRYGGEEFAVVFQGITIEDSHEIMESVRNYVYAQTFSFLGGEHISVSIGIVANKKNETDPNVLFENADWAMYMAKQSGRNRIVVN